MARVAPKTATMVFDVPMAKSGLRYNATIAKLHPDGILVDETHRQIHLLEFARTGDNCQVHCYYCPIYYRVQVALDRGGLDEALAVTRAPHQRPLADDH
eukprot:2610353-Rhodomonas_salina.1